MSVFVVSGGRDRMLTDQGSYWLPHWYAGHAGAIEAGPLSPHAIYAGQSAVRTVTAFAARNIASIPLHVYRRVSDVDRVRVTDHPLARSLESPQPHRAQYRWLSNLVLDALLYDRWAALKMWGEDGETIRLYRVPPPRFAVETTVLGDVTGIRSFGGRLYDPEVFVFDAGYSADGFNGTPPMESIRALLTELQEGAAYRAQLWRNGARVPAVIERPADAPDWTDPARERFRRQWQEWYAGEGARAGSVPVLEDGMKLGKGEAFTAADSQWHEGRQLAVAEVASAFHIAPELVGARKGNYSNVREYRQALYRDSLGPHLAAFEQVLNARLVPEFADADDLYVEFAVEAKLRGSFEEQANYLTRAVGGPWMTRSEARARSNLPEIAGADELIVPLNVTAGGQANPADSVPDSRPIGRRALAPAGKSAQDLARRLGTARSVLAVGMVEFFTRQGRAVVSGLGGKSMPPLMDAWDSDRWNRELAAVIERHALSVGTVAALDVLNEHDGEDYDVAAVEPWLVAASANNAKGINAATYAALAAAVASPDWREEVAGVFSVAAAVRAGQAATTITTEAANFARVDAAAGRGLAVKTWRTASGTPRPSHAAVNGQTVPLTGRFSNGGRWPGDRSLPSDERAGCLCVLDVSRE